MSPITLVCDQHTPHMQAHKLCLLIQGTSPYAVAKDLPYLDMVVDETLRLYPPAARYAKLSAIYSMSGLNLLTARMSVCNASPVSFR